MALPRPIVFIGAKDGAIALELSSKCNSGFFAPGDAKFLADHIQEAYQSWPPDLVPDIRPTSIYRKPSGFGRSSSKMLFSVRMDQLTGNSFQRR